MKGVRSLSTDTSSFVELDRPRLLSAEGVLRLLVAVAALGLIASGLFAMLAPESFFNVLAVYPPYNRHFIHDIGAFMLGLGAALGFALSLTDALLVALAANAVGAVAHFVSHFVDRELGGSPSDPLTFGVFALLMVGLTVWRFRRRSDRGYGIQMPGAG
jgi:hypothetical protein